jgi:hypothetical protein
VTENFRFALGTVANCESIMIGERSGPTVVCSQSAHVRSCALWVHIQESSVVSLQPEPPSATSLHKRPRDAPGRAITHYHRIQENLAFCRCHIFALYSPIGAEACYTRLPREAAPCFAINLAFFRRFKKRVMLPLRYDCDAVLPQFQHPD